MNSVILRATTRLLIAVLLLLSVFLLLRGHNLPGGGFIGGLVAASAVALYAIAFGPARAYRVLPLPPQVVAAMGLAVALGAGLLAAFTGRPFLSGLWLTVYVGDVSYKLGTPLLFDVGVYLLVIGVVLTMLLALEEY